MRLACAEAARFVLDPEAQERAITEARRAARSDREQALVSSEHGEWLRRNRRSLEALETLERAVELALVSGDDETRARAVARRASALVTLGRLSDAGTALLGLAAIEPGLTPATHALVQDVRGYLAGNEGDFGARSEAYARAAALYAEAGDLRRAAGAQSNRADADNRLGRFAAARGALAEALELARKLGNRLTEGYALLNLGYALTGEGRTGEATSALEAALRIARSIGDAHLGLGARLYLARASMAERTSPEQAREIEALVVEAAGDPTLEANARVLASRAWLRAAEPAEALRHAEAALALRDEHGAIEEGEGELFAAVAEALTASGRLEDAELIRGRARLRAGELGSRIADPDARRSFLEAFLR
jgi:tetratricopeptide (TPR) repeat protein